MTSKRPPSESLEALVLSGKDSPQRKRVKVEDVMDEEYASNGHHNVDLPDNKADTKAHIKKYEDEDDELDREALESATTAADKEPPPEYSDLYLDTSVCLPSVGKLRLANKFVLSNSQSPAIGFRLRETVFSDTIQYQCLRMSSLWKVLPRSREIISCILSCSR